MSHSADYKMVVCVRKDLGMSAGKVAAQVGHGVLGCYRQLDSRAEWKEVKRCWEQRGEKIVVLKLRSHNELMQIAELAAAQKLPHAVVDDATLECETVVAIGPAKDEAFVGITNQLSVYA